MAERGRTSKLSAKQCDACVEKAAYWLARKDAQDLSQQDQIAFDRWLGEAADNVWAYRRVASAWTLLEGAEFGSAELHRFRVAALEVRPSPWRLRSATALSAVGCLIFAGWFLVPSRTPAPQVSQQVADVHVLHRSYATRVGESAVFRLQDGSQITLNSDTAMSIAFGSGRRSIKVDHGQVFFDVAKDPRRPFVVQVGSRQITAIGTAFEVLQTSGRLAITLEHGTIRVDRAETASWAPRAFNPARQTGIIMTPGHRLSVRAGEADHVTVVDLPRALAWRVGRVEFDDEPLRDIVSDINRYSDKPVVLANERIAALRLSGVMQTDAPEDFLRALPELLPVAVVDNLLSNRIEIREIEAK